MTSSLPRKELVERCMGILQPVENFIANFYRQHPETHDYDVLSAYEALSKYFKAKLTNFPLPQHKLNGVSYDIYSFQLSFLETMEGSYSLKEIYDCLKTLEKSLKLWTKNQGSRGYLNYIIQFN